jgi:hypothetical protein
MCKFCALPLIVISFFLVVVIVIEILNLNQDFLLQPFPLIAGFLIGILNILTGLLLLTKE